LNELSASELKELRKIQEKYKSYKELKNNGSVEDISLYKQFFDAEKKSSIHLQNVFKSLEGYQFDKSHFLSIIKRKIGRSIENSNYREASTDCEELALQFYIEQLNYYYYVSGWDIETADREASRDANYFYFGCVIGQVGEAP